ncbi:hypothetical protein LBMAG49_21130 [Planctomycetota bacterium]|nr:hypothetical protein LBMAG49_21130 [Planctomycetota bacterium]
MQWFWIRTDLAAGGAEDQDRGYSGKKQRAEVADLGQHGGSVGPQRRAAKYNEAKNIVRKFCQLFAHKA